MNLYNEHKRLARNYTLLADEYEHTMAAGYLNNKKNEKFPIMELMP